MQSDAQKILEIEDLKQSVSNLEAKVDQLFMRPRMPYTQGAASGDVLTLDSNLQPFWDTPTP
jgi:hypothetical protein